MTYYNPSEELLLRPFDLKLMSNSPLILLIGKFKNSLQSFLNMYLNHVDYETFDFYTGGNKDQDKFFRTLYRNSQHEQEEMEKKNDLGYYYDKQNRSQKSIFVTSAEFASNHNYPLYQSDTFISFRKFVDNHYVLDTTMIILLTLDMNNKKNIIMPLYLNPNINYIFFALDLDVDPDILQTIYKHYIGLFGSFGKFVDVYKYLAYRTAGFGYLVIDRKNYYSNCFTNHVKFLDLRLID